MIRRRRGDVLAATELLWVVRRLPSRAKVTARLAGTSDLKAAWVGWLSEYGTPGFYKRKTAGVHAQSAWSHLKSASMLAWLAEQLGEEPTRVKAGLEHAKGASNPTSAAARFRRVVPWNSIEPRVRAQLGSSVRTPQELRRKILRLSRASPETDSFSRRWLRKQSGQREQAAPWYTHQKQHWLGWLGDYSGAGAYGRANWNRSAEFVFNHVVNPQMLIWLAEAVGVDRQMVRRAVRAALTRRSMAAMSGAVRRVIPWSVIEPLLSRSR